MIIIYNFITSCKYLINNIIWYDGMYCIDFECLEDDNAYNDDDDDDDDDIKCGCNLCNTQENIYFFFTRYFKCKKF